MYRFIALMCKNHFKKYALYDNINILNIKEVKKMNIAVMGYGTVGSGVVEVIDKNHKSIVKKSGQDDIKVKYILDRRDFPMDPHNTAFTKNFNDILEDDSIKVVVETMGGIHPAFEFESELLKRGKSVCTSNKELVAAKGDELLRLAEENNCNFLFEASVGGGIPIIRPISQCLAANEIDEIAGILNGTTNFILTMMIENGMTFEQALSLAQENGYAEKDPTADIEGLDAQRKISILSSLCFGHQVDPNTVYTEGITKITSEDVDYAENCDSVIKLIGRAKRLKSKKISAMVSPCFISKSSQLANVKDVFNAILVRGNAIGDVIFYGQGAGKLPTASAVVADVIDCAKHLERHKLFGWGKELTDYVVPHTDINSKLYVRANSKDVDINNKLKSIFGDLQFLSRKNQPTYEIAFITPVDTEKCLVDKLSSIKELEILNIIRVLEF